MKKIKISLLAIAMVVGVAGALSAKVKAVDSAFFLQSTNPTV